MRHGFLPGSIQPGGGLALPGPTCLINETFKTSVVSQVEPGVPFPCFPKKWAELLQKNNYYYMKNTTKGNPGIR